MAENAREAVLTALEVALDFPDQPGPVRWEVSIGQFWMALYEEGYEVVPRIPKVYELIDGSSASNGPTSASEAK